MSTATTPIAPTPVVTKRTAFRIFGLSVSTIIRYVLLVALAVIFSGPLLWMVSLSLKPDNEMNQIPPQLVPIHPTFDNYGKALYGYLPMVDFNRIAINTIIYVTLATLGVLFSSATVGYGFARIPFKGSGVLFPIVLATLMLPSQVTLIPQYLLFKQLDWINSLKPLTIPVWFGGIQGAFYIFLFRQFFLTIPREFDDAALIDGASHFDILWRIMLPLSVPAAITCVALSIVEHWNDFFGPLIYAPGLDVTVIAVFLTYFSVPQQSTPVNLLMAAATVSVVPVILVFLVLQDYFVQGVTMTGLKEG